MATVSRGGDITLQAQFYEFNGGDPTDATNVTLEIIANGNTVAGPFTEPAIQDTGVGSYEYTWSVPTDAALTTHTAKWQGTINGNTSTGYEYFDVVAAGSVETGGLALFVTTDDVLRITGTAVSNDQITVAQHIIEMASNRRSKASGDMTSRDLHWLKLAVAYQSAYIDKHDELFTMADVESLSQGDFSVSFRGNAEEALIAPLARKALKNVTWMRSRSILLNSHFQRGSIDADRQGYADRDTDEWSAI